MTVVGEDAFGQADAEVMVAPPPTVERRLEGLELIALGIDGVGGGMGLGEVEQSAHQLVGDEGGLVGPGEAPAVDGEEVGAEALDPPREELFGVTLDIRAATRPTLGLQYMRNWGH